MVLSFAARLQNLPIADRARLLSFALGAKAPAPGRPIRCPSPDHDDSHASGQVWSSGLGIYCHGCGLRAGIIDLVVISRQISRREAAALIEREIGR